MIASGTEVAALGKVLIQAARSVSPSTAGPLSPVERARAYGGFHHAATDVLVWAEMTLVQQKSLGPSWRPMLAAVGAVVPSGWIPGSSERVGLAVRAWSPVARLLLAGQMAEQFDQHRALRAQVANFRDISSRLLSALAELRLVGGREPQMAAEHVVTVIGEMLSVMPVVQDRIIQQHLPPLGQYETARNAVGHHLLEFSRLARLDLNRWPWRRHSREHWWQQWRPKIRKVQLASEDVESLIQQATESSA